MLSSFISSSAISRRQPPPPGTGSSTPPDATTTGGNRRPNAGGATDESEDDSGEGGGEDTTYLRRKQRFFLAPILFINLEIPMRINQSLLQFGNPRLASVNFYLPCSASASATECSRRLCITPTRPRSPFFRPSPNSAQSSK